MVNRSQQKGTQFESSLLPFLQSYFSADVHRLGKQGVKDKGDFWLPAHVRFIIEAKNESSYAGKLSGWLAEAAAEAANAGKQVGIVVHKRKGVTDPGAQYVTLTLGDLLYLLLPATC